MNPLLNLKKDSVEATCVLIPDHSPVFLLQVNRFQKLLFIIALPIFIYLSRTYVTLSDILFSFT